MTWKHICAASDVPANSVKKFTAGGVPLIIVNYGSGFRALPPVCPHMEEPLEDSAVVARCVLTCTKHLWAWNLESFAMLGETEKPLQHYEVKEEGGALLAFIDKEIVYEFDSGDEDDDDDFFKK